MTGRINQVASSSESGALEQQRRNASAPNARSLCRTHARTDRKSLFRAREVKRHKQRRQTNARKRHAVHPSSEFSRQARGCGLESQIGFATAADRLLS